MKWDFKSGEPIYQQIMRVLRTQIASGEYPPGCRFPAVRELALEAGVNPNTMQRALAELEREGLLETVRTTGKFVTEDQELISRTRNELAADSIRALIGSLKNLGLTEEQILKEVEHSLKDIE
jgi:DNA-binding transcriptional regulator YhcF (GntR family)